MGVDGVQSVAAFSALQDFQQAVKMPSVFNIIHIIPKGVGLTEVSAEGLSMPVSFQRIE
jgi:hypothetical protein